VKWASKTSSRPPGGGGTSREWRLRLDPAVMATHLHNHLCFSLTAPAGEPPSVGSSADLPDATLHATATPYRGVAWHGTREGPADGRPWRAIGTVAKPKGVLGEIGRSDRN